MRLTCPNCGAQYEVPDEVIPKEGRDVQCSNCGDTWFQSHPDNPEAAPDMPAPEPQGAGDDYQQPPEDRATRHDAPDAQDDWHDDGPDHGPDDGPDETPPPPETDPGISDILREEAEREAQLRALESQTPLESQPDLGLDNAPGDESSRRAREARDRMARMRGQETDEAEVDPGSRRGLLPNIEEINSTLRASDNTGGSSTAVGPVRNAEPSQKRGFSRGFSLVLVIAVGLALVYAKAETIANAVPQAEPALNAYVGGVDQARLWLDSKLGQYLPKP